MMLLKETQIEEVTLENGFSSCIFDQTVYIFQRVETKKRGKVQVSDKQNTIYSFLTFSFLFLFLQMTCCSL